RPDVFATATSLVLASSLGLTLLAGALALPLVRWFGNSEFVGPYLVLLLTIPVSALVGIPTAKLERELNFRTPATIELAAQCVGLVVSLTLALCRAGVWAPVAGLASWQTTNLLAAYWSIWQFPQIGWNRSEEHTSEL